MSKQHGADMCESRCIWRGSFKLCSAHVPYAKGAMHAIMRKCCAGATRNDCVLLEQMLRDEAAIVWRQRRTQSAVWSL